MICASDSVVESAETCLLTQKVHSFLFPECILFSHLILLADLPDQDQLKTFEEFIMYFCQLWLQILRFCYLNLHLFFEFQLQCYEIAYPNFQKVKLILSKKKCFFKCF